MVGFHSGNDIGLSGIISQSGPYSNDIDNSKPTSQFIWTILDSALIPSKHAVSFQHLLLCRHQLGLSPQQSWKSLVIRDQVRKKGGPELLARCGSASNKESRTIRYVRFTSL